MNAFLFAGEEESQLKVLLRKVRLHNTDNHCDCPYWHYVCSLFFNDLPIWCLIQSEDDCAGHETTRYTFFIGDREVGNITADMPGLRSFNKRGDVAEVTLSVPTHVAKSSLILRVVLSNTVEFTENITFSSSGVSSALRSNTWYTTSEPHYCKFFSALSPF